MKIVLKPLAESVLIPTGLTGTASATDAAIQKKTFESKMTALIISNKEMDDIMMIVNFLEESGLLIKRVSRTTKNEKKEHKRKFISMFLGALGASLL